MKNTKVKSNQKSNGQGDLNVYSKLFRNVLIVLSPKEWIKALIWVYQKLFSFDHSFWAKPEKYRVCVHHPSCSAYAYEAIDKHGVIKGMVMGSFRVLRCTPFTRHHIDPVPDKFSIKANPISNR